MDGLAKLTTPSKLKLGEVLEHHASKAENGNALAGAIKLLETEGVSNKDLLDSLVLASKQDVHLVHEALSEFTASLRELPAESPDTAHILEFSICLSRLEAQHVQISQIRPQPELSQELVTKMQTWGTGIAERLPDRATALETEMIRDVHAGGGATHTLHLSDTEDVIVKFESHDIPPEREYYFNLLAKHFGLPSPDIALIHPEHSDANKVTNVFHEGANAPVSALMMSHIP